MANANSPAPDPMHMWTWSQTEKRAARRAFELALGREFETVMRKAKERAARIDDIPELWELEDWLGKQRRRIDRTYDYRYSVLPLVFARLIYDGKLTEDDLCGINSDKIEVIHRIVTLNQSE